MSLARRSVTSVSWNMAANLSASAILLVRSLALARLLPVDVFGVYTFASATVALTIVFAMFGMDGAFLYRTDETRDEAEAAAVHFTLKLLFTVLWASILISVSFAIASGPERSALIFLVLVRGLAQLLETPQLMLVRRIVHRRLALLQLLDAILTTAVAIMLAWGGFGLRALLATDLVSLLVTFAVLVVWRPFWRPRLRWSASIVRYYLRFGRRNLAATVLSRTLDRVDDLWTGAYLGRTPLGFYSRAYTFATYPRQILAAPIARVAGGTYAELKDNRLKLSQAFFRSNALLVRSGFFLAGLLALLAPEFIRQVIGPKWLPMLDTFQLMLLFTLLDPIKGTVANLFIAVGQPERIVRARLAQLVVLGIGMFTLGPAFGIVGVALAVDVMLLVGIGLLMWQARTFVDFSALRLFGAPGVGLGLGLLLAWRLASLPQIVGTDWRTAAVKIAAFTAVYGLILLLLERRQLREMAVQLRRLLPGG